MSDFLKLVSNLLLIRIITQTSNNSLETVEETITDGVGKNESEEEEEEDKEEQKEEEETSVTKE